MLSSMAAGSSARLRACHCCGLVHTLPAVVLGEVALCSRCGARIYRPRGRHANAWSFATALSALILYPVAISLPVLEIERFGHMNAASIWSGVISLLSRGHMLVGVVVLVCSVVIPLLKLAGLLAITSRGGILSRRHRAGTYRLIEQVGRWGMVDVLLVALMVAILKLGDLVEVTPGPGVLAFTLCVGLSLVASACFDPHALWEGEP
jgi:paraquat-inducible protein A